VNLTRRAARDEPVPPAAPDRTEAVLGLAALAFDLGLRLGRLALLPGRVLARSPVVEPAVRGGTEALAAAGRDVESRGRERLEEAVDRALAAPLPEGVGDEAIERLTQRLFESPAFERALRDAAQSRLARDLIDDAVRSPQLQRALEEVLSGPAMRNALRRETRTFWNEVAARVRASAYRLDDRLLRRPHVEAVRYGGLASRGTAFAIDSAVTQLTALLVGTLFGLAGSLLGIAAPTWLVAALGSVGWALFVGGYFVFFWATAGQTPGQRLLRVRVTGGDGGPIRVRRALVRFVGLVLAIAPLGAGFLPVLFDRRRRGLHDFLARTVVVVDADDPA
jgi:uncharacterized RDD family membrane protein YckC